MSQPTFRFLDQSLDGSGSAESFRAGEARWRWLARGILEIVPGTGLGPGPGAAPDADPDLPAAIISVGVHGDETVPVRLIDQWLAQLLTQVQTIRRPMLIVLANPDAVCIGKRFVKHNMNRLFCLPAASAPDDEPGTYDDENSRAVDIMQAVQRFVAAYPAGMHFDLHSTIKPSDQDRFAVVPVDCQGRDLTALKNWLRLFAVDAWVQNISPAAAFSSFTAGLGYLSATVELGQVSSLDEPIERFLSLLPALDRLAFDEEEQSRHAMSGFQVIDEIIRPEGEFELCLQDFVNFRSLTAGTLIASANGGASGGANGGADGHEWRIEQTGDALLFLNAQVPAGHRAGLVIRQR